MFVENNASCEQISMFNSTYGLTEREKKFLEKSWAKPFAEYIFPAIDEKPFSVLYSSEPSRGNTPVNVLVGACILQQLTDLSDDEILNSLLFDIRFQYALHTVNMEEQPLSDRSLGRFRARCIAYEAETGTDLLKNAVDSLNKQIAELMKIDHSLKRMDSMMIASNIRRMTRLELIYTCTANLVRKVKKSGIEVPESLLHYTEDNDRNKVVYHSRSMAAGDRIDAILKDAKILKELADLHIDRFCDSSEYLLFVRMLNEQTTIDDDGNYHLKQGKSAKAEDAEETSGHAPAAPMHSGILQNPADPDATFREKDEKQYRGYAGNVTEESTSDGRYSIITDYQYDSNNTSDQTFGKQALEGMEPSEGGSVLVADGLFHGGEMEDIAKEKNITILNTNLSGRCVPDFYAGFEFSSDGKHVTKCPGGFCPKKCSYNAKSGQCVAAFDRKQCESCPYHDQCRPRMNSKTSRKTISVKAKVRAEKQVYRSSEEFTKYSNYRNGVEAVPSFFRRHFHVDRMPVRGKLRTKFYFGCMVAASNVMKFCTFMNSGEYCAQN